MYELQTIKHTKNIKGIFSMKKLWLTFTFTIILILSIILYFVFDINSEIDLIKNPEKYSFNYAISNGIIKEDYIVSKKIKKSETVYKDIKFIEKKYSSKNDNKSLKLISITNKAFDLYNDIKLNNKINSNYYLLTNDELIFLYDNEKKLQSAYVSLLLIYPQVEEIKILKQELKIRKELIKEIKKDLQDKNITAKINLENIEFETIAPVYIDYKEIPHYINDFRKIFRNILLNVDKKIVDKYGKKPLEIEDVKTSKEAVQEYRNEFWNEVEKINPELRHRYMIKIYEKEDREKLHIYKAHRYKEGNRYYWNIEYNSPNSKLIEAYLKVLQLLM